DFSEPILVIIVFLWDITLRCIFKVCFSLIFLRADISWYFCFTIVIIYSILMSVLYSLVADINSSFLGLYWDLISSRRFISLSHRYLVPLNMYGFLFLHQILLGLFFLLA
ncbi:hypothetical protein EGW08_004612, partial [Elysia chlorotica]